MFDLFICCRSRPVINVEASVLFNTHNKVIGLDERNCTIGRDKYVSCTTLNACVKYNGVGVGNGISTLKLLYVVCYIITYKLYLKIW